MSRSIDEFLRAATKFARDHPEATLAMPAPELAVDDRARAHHLPTTCLRVRARMRTTARLATREGRPATPDLFACASAPEHSRDTA